MNPSSFPISSGTPNPQRRGQQTPQPPAINGFPHLHGNNRNFDSYKRHQRSKGNDHPAIQQKAFRPKQGGEGELPLQLTVGLVGSGGLAGSNSPDGPIRAKRARRTKHFP
ncbi:hypothetical protein ACLOJK_004716, partial [Asimina triloba]